MIDSMLVAGTVWYIHKRWRRKQATQEHLTELELLGRRYAQGEIGRNEYWQVRDDIMGCSTMRRVSRSLVSKARASIMA